LEIIKTRIKQ